MNVLALLLLLSVGTPQGDLCDPPCERRAAEELIESSEIRPAIDRLRAAVEKYPDDSTLSVLLARAYLLDGNLFWAEKTLAATILRRPDDTEAHAWLALVQLRQGDPELADETLRNAPVPSVGPEQTRRSLLSAYRSILAGDPATARSSLDLIGHRAQIFPEDRPVRDLLLRQTEPWWVAPVSTEIDLIGGNTSNALAGAPTDPGTEGTGSGFLDGTMRLRIAPPVAAPVRPFLDVEETGHLIGDEDYRELSSLESASRIGFLVNRERYRVLIGYRAEILELDQEPSRFSRARRLEIELQSTDGWLVFGGAGHRDYRDDLRTRSEWDFGGGTPLHFGSNKRVVVGGTVRGSSARSRGWDLIGISLAAATWIPLPANLIARVSGTASWDDYLHSGGAEGLIVFGSEEKRRDLTGKIAVELWLPSWRGVNVGIHGQFMSRDSTADQRPGYDFDYNDIRIGLRLRFAFSIDPTAPRIVRIPGHVPLEWGIGPGEASEAGEIIQLLRQDEELRRGSSCGT